MYDTLSEVFDTLEEEVIGLLKSENVTEFPLSTLNMWTIDYEESDYHTTYKILINNLFSILTFSEFQNFVENAPKNGIKNLLEEIYSATNKADYLLKMTIKNAPKQVSDNSVIGTQTDISVDSPIQTFEIQPTL